MPGLEAKVRRTNQKFKHYVSLTWITVASTVGEAAHLPLPKNPEITVMGILLGRAGLGVEKEKQNLSARSRQLVDKLPLTLMVGCSNNANAEADGFPLAPFLLTLGLTQYPDR